MDVIIDNRPDATQLQRFVSVVANGYLALTWSTGLEVNTRGFHIWRSVDGERAHASRITPNLIQARGNNSTYRFEDTTAERNVRYFYWLQEVTRDGATIEYGSIEGMLAPWDGYRIYLPHVERR